MSSINDKDNQWASFEVSKAAKEAGFNSPCNAAWNISKYDGTPKPHFYTSGFTIYNGGAGKNQIARPLWQQLIDWLREKHKVIVTYGESTDGIPYWDIFTPNDKRIVGGLDYYDSREKVITEAIQRFCVKDV